MKNNSFAPSTVALSTPFDNTSNSFTATEVQSAIEEARNSIVGKTFSITLSNNGTISNNQWVGFTEVIPGDSVPFYLHRNCVLEDIIFSNNRNCDVDFDFYKNGTAGGNIIKTWSIRNLQYTSLTSQTDAFVASDLLRIRARTSGLIGGLLGVTPNDVGIILVFRYT